MNKWQPITNAQRDGQVIQARIPGHGDDNMISWEWLDSYTGAWRFIEDQEPPDCWTDGVCWDVNADLKQSVQPTHFKGEVQ